MTDSVAALEATGLRHSDHEKIRSVHRSTVRPTPAASVIVVTHGRRPGEIQPTFEHLETQTTEAFELIVVDNGSQADLQPLLEDCGRIDWYLQLDRNYGVNAARNLGAHLARGAVLIFLDDDGIPPPNFVEQHLRAHREYDIVAARGRVLPKTPSIYNDAAGHYDLGNEVKPFYLNVEGNASVDRHAFLEVDGFDETVWGHEGLLLSRRLLAAHGPECVIYFPAAAIYHDYSTSFLEYARKTARHDVAQRWLESHHPDLFTVQHRYHADETGGWPTLSVRVLQVLILEHLASLAATVCLWWDPDDIRAAADWSDPER